MIKYQYFIVVALLAFFTKGMKAQDFYAGPLLGASFSQIDGDSYRGYNKLGLVLGGFVGRELSDHWKTQLEIVYIQKGSSATPDVEAGDYSDYKVDLRYIQFPLTMQLTTGLFSFEGGLSYGRLLNYYEEVYGAPIADEDQVPFKNSEWSTIFGFSYHITEQFLVNVRFNYSLFRVREPYDGDIPVYDAHWDFRKPGQYNHVVSMSFYYNLMRR
jgi:hypothetical protein